MGYVRKVRTVQLRKMNEAKGLSRAAFRRVLKAALLLLWVYHRRKKSLSTTTCKQVIIDKLSGYPEDGRRMFEKEKRSLHPSSGNRDRY